MRILVVGDVNSVFVRSYCSNLKKFGAGTVSIDLFATQTPYKIDDYSVYNTIHAYPHLPFLYKWQVFRMFFRILFLLKLLRAATGRYEAIHFQYALLDLVPLQAALRRTGSRLIITVFGSDFNRLTESRKKMFTGVYGSADCVTFANEQTRDAFLAYYLIGKEQTRICRFGLEPLEEIIKIKAVPVSESRRILGFPEGRTIISIGYNLSASQQHLPVMLALQADPRIAELKEKLFFVFPLTYGNDPVYKSKLTDALKEFPLDHCTLDHFLSDAENAHLRKAVDIMIQVQVADQLSGSMQEQLFAGGLVITGSWLPYTTFRENNVYMLNVDAIDAIPGCLLNLLDHFEEEKKKCAGNPEVIYRMSSWESNIGNWLSLYHKSNS